MQFTVNLSLLRIQNNHSTLREFSVLFSSLFCIFSSHRRRRQFIYHAERNDSIIDLIEMCFLSKTMLKCQNYYMDELRFHKDTSKGTIVVSIADEVNHNFNVYTQKCSQFIHC